MFSDDELTAAERLVVRDLDRPGLVMTTVPGADNEVTARVLTALLTDPAHTGHAQPLFVIGARVTGKLDLEFETLNRSFVLYDCDIEEQVDLTDATTMHVALVKSRIAGVRAQRVHVRGNLNLRQSRVDGGPVDLLHAQVDQQFLLGGARLSNPGGCALRAPGITVGKGMHFDEGDTESPVPEEDVFAADGLVDLSSAQIGSVLSLMNTRLRNDTGGRALNAERVTVRGSMRCDGMAAEGAVVVAYGRIDDDLCLDRARLTVEDGYALNAEGVQVGENLRFEDGFTATGAITTADAKVGRSLLLGGARVTAPGDVAFKADRIDVTRDMLCTRRFTVHGQVSLTGAHIGGDLALTGAWLRHPRDYALVAQNLTVGQNVTAHGGFVARGGISLPGAHIGGSLELHGGAVLGALGERALSAENLVVDRSLFCDDGIRVVGEVYLVGARVASTMDISDARLTNTGRKALDVESATVGRCLFGRDELTVHGEVKLTGAKLEELDLRGATLVNPSGAVLTARGLEVNQNVQLSGLTAHGAVVLTGAQVGGVLKLRDALLAGTGERCADLSRVRTPALEFLPKSPPSGVVDLTDAQVGVFDDAPATWPATLRLRGFRYESFGHEQAGVTQRLRSWLPRDDGGFTPGPYDQLAATYRQAGQPEAARRVGYAKQRRRRAQLSRPGRAWNVLLQATVGFGYRPWLAGLWLLALLGVGSVVYAMAHPADMVAAGPKVPEFNPVAYALDVLLPVVDLGQQRAWVAQGPALPCSWVLTIAGWVLATLVITGVTNALKRE